MVGTSGVRDRRDDAYKYVVYSKDYLGIPQINYPNQLVEKFCAINASSPRVADCRSFFLFWGVEMSNKINQSRTVFYRQNLLSAGRVGPIKTINVFVMCV
jgi:hypothetical protein